MYRTADEWNRAIESSFSKASQNYEEAAPVQRKAADFLADQIERYGEREGTLVEFGAGSGFLTRRLLSSFRNASLLAVDLSPCMLHALHQSLLPEERQRVSCCACDMDAFETKENTLICSSFALQWSKDPLSLLSRSASSLQPDGLLAHAVPIQGSLRSLVAEGYVRPIPQLSLSMEEWLHALNPLSVLSAEVIEVEEIYATPLQALRYIKSFGGAVASALPRSLFSIREKRGPIACEWSIGFFVARRKP